MTHDSLNLPSGARVLVAMSGGVDSAVTAALLVEQGYDCIGVTMRLVPEHPGKSVFEPCCGLEATQDAARVCEKLGIPHQVLHAVERFDRDIIDYFVEEYTQGRTPNPCVRCNRMIKFGALYQRADELGAAAIAMGHYARLEPHGSRIGLRRAVHRPKDQSYVLAPLTQRQLRRALFPLGHMTKDEVRERALGLHFECAAKPDSQEICFVHDREYGRFVEERHGKGAPGPIVNSQGQLLGKHKGLLHYTLGQRRGLGIAAAAPLYVIKLDTESNAVVVGVEEETFGSAFRTGAVCWGAMGPRELPFAARVQLRSRHQPVRCTVTPIGRCAEVALHTPEKAITPGQWAVFYDADEFVLASAIIKAPMIN